MKVVQINSVCGQGSTGKICVGISQILTKNKIENYILYTDGSSEYPLGIRYSRHGYIKLQALKSRFFGNYGYNSTHATKKLIQQLKRIQPDIIHIHNIHGHDCNLRMLFSYLRKKQIRLYWTFHDCWPFTGYCAYFTMAKCEQWKTGCMNCPQYKEYSWITDRSQMIWNQKKRDLSGLNLTIITPSRWLSDLVKQSYLGQYPVKVIHNGIDLSIFKPTNSMFRQQHNCENKSVVLGVAYEWEKRKGLDVFIDLVQRLDANYQIVLVGTDDETDKLLPSSIISIHRTHSQEELVGLYSTADLLVNPTREDNFPTVNLEALACGTPVITFATGGSPEMLDKTCGAVVPCDDVDSLADRIRCICSKSSLDRKACRQRAAEFNQDIKFNEYIDLYTESV